MTAPPETIAVLQDFFDSLERLNVRRPSYFRSQLDVKELDSNLMDRDHVEYAGHARYFLRMLKCDLIYSGHRLVIGTQTEIKQGLQTNVFSFQRIAAQRQADLSPVISDDQPIENRSSSSALVRIGVRFTPQLKAREEARQELKEQVIELLRLGRPEQAATVLFSDPERSISQKLSLVKDISQLEDVFGAYEDLLGVQKFQGDLHDVHYDETAVSNEILLLGFLLGRYADQAPLLAGKVLSSAITSGFGLITNVDRMVSILAVMERAEYRAQAVLGFLSLGKRSSFNIVNQAFVLALSEDQALFNNRFQSTLEELHRVSGECFVAAEDYNGATIYSDLVKIENLLQGMSAAYGERLYLELSPDLHLVRTLEEMLDNYEDDIAAYVAFLGYRDIIVRFETLASLGFIRLGRIMWAAERETRTKALRNIAFALDLDNDKQVELGEEVALAALFLGGEKDLARAAEFYHDLVLDERFAARKLLYIGSSGRFSFQAVADYGDVYDRLEEAYPEVYVNNHRRFIESDGVINAAKDVYVVGARSVQVKHYFGVLIDESQSDRVRIASAKMLGYMGAVEYLDDLRRKVISPALKAKKYDELTMIVVKLYLDICEELDLGKSDHQRMYRKAARYLRRTRNIIIAFFLANIETGYRTLVTKGFSRTSQGIKAKRLSLAKVGNKEEIISIVSKYLAKERKRKTNTYNKIRTMLKICSVMIRCQFPRQDIIAVLQQVLSLFDEETKRESLRSVYNVIKLGLQGEHTGISLSYDRETLSLRYFFCGPAHIRKLIENTNDFSGESLSEVACLMSDLDFPAGEVRSVFEKALDIAKDNSFDLAEISILMYEAGLPLSQAIEVRRKAYEVMYQRSRRPIKRTEQIRNHGTIFYVKRVTTIDQQLERDKRSLDNHKYPRIFGRKRRNTSYYIPELKDIGVDWRLSEGQLKLVMQIYRHSSPILDENYPEDSIITNLHTRIYAILGMKEDYDQESRLLLQSPDTEE